MSLYGLWELPHFFEVFIEFKETLYSSPMTMLRDEIKDKYSTSRFFTGGGTLVCQLPSGLHHTHDEGDVNRGMSQLFPPWQEGGMQDGNEEIGPLSP